MRGNHCRLTASFGSLGKPSLPGGWCSSGKVLQWVEATQTLKVSKSWPALRVRSWTGDPQWSLPTNHSMLLHLIKHWQRQSERAKHSWRKCCPRCCRRLHEDTWALPVVETPGGQSKWEFSSQKVRERLSPKRCTSTNQGPSMFPRKISSCNSSTLVGQQI